MIAAKPGFSRNLKNIQQCADLRYFALILKLLSCTLTVCGLLQCDN